MSFVPSINLHQLQLSLLTLIDLEYEFYTHSLQTDTLIMNSLTYEFDLSVHFSISYMFGSSLLTMCIFVCGINKNIAYLQLMSKRCTSSNSIISVTLMD